MGQFASSKLSTSPSQSSGSITFCPARHKPQSVGNNANFGTAVSVGDDPPLSMLRAVVGKKENICAELLHSSLPTSPDAFRDIIPRKNGFVNTVVEAFSKHHALIIRPDDVWLAILTQFSFFVNGNAEALRHVFVGHEGKRELVIEALGVPYGTEPGPGLLVHQMTKLMQEHIVDKSLREWMMPSFTTTTATDTATSSIVMMGSMKEYFSYTMAYICGIPRVTLEGEKEDWEDILRRLERLKRYGIQTIAWYHLLRPIISRFVAAYDDPTSRENLDFWNKVVHSTGPRRPCSPVYLSGWITAFCVFDQLGKWCGNPINADAENATDPQHLSTSQFVVTHLDPGQVIRDMSYLTLDDVPYPEINSRHIPYGFTYVDVKLEDGGKTLETMFVAGSIGSHVSSTVRSGLGDTMQPMPGWWHFIKEKIPEKIEDESWRELLQGLGLGL